MNKPTLHDKTLSLAVEYAKDRGKIQDLAAVAQVTHQRIWYWLKRQEPGKPVRLNADAIQRLYEHLTGKQLEY